MLKICALFSPSPKDSYILEITLPTAAANRSVTRSFTDSDESSICVKNDPKIGDGFVDATGSAEATPAALASSCVRREFCLVLW